MEAFERGKLGIPGTLIMILGFVVWNEEVTKLIKRIVEIQQYKGDTTEHISESLWLFDMLVFLYFRSCVIIIII